MRSNLTYSRPARAIRRRFGHAQRQRAVRTTFECETPNWDALTRVAVAPNSGFLYNRVHKNANSSIITLLHGLETGRNFGVMRSRTRVSHLGDWPIHRIEALAGLPRMVVIRDPFARTLSAFLNKVDTPRFRADIGHMTPTPESFSQFLHWLDDGGRDLNPHWDLQSKQLLFPLDTYTDVIRFEQLNTGLSDFFDRLGIDPDRVLKFGGFRRGQAHRTDANARMGQFYTTQGAQIVQRLFATDFDTLGYDANWRPT